MSNDARILPACADCYLGGQRGSAHDPQDCPQRAAAIARAERGLEDAQRRLDGLRAGLRDDSAVQT